MSNLNNSNDNSNIVCENKTKWPLIFDPTHFQRLNVRIDRKNFRKVFYDHVNKYLIPKKSEERLKGWMLRPQEIPSDPTIYSVLNECLVRTLHKQREYLSSQHEIIQEKIKETINSIKVYEKGSEIPFSE